MIAARARASSRCRPLPAAVDLALAVANVATAIVARARHGAADSGGP